MAAASDSNDYLLVEAAHEEFRPSPQPRRGVVLTWMSWGLLVGAAALAVLVNWR